MHGISKSVYKATVLLENRASTIRQLNPSLTMRTSLLGAIIAVTAGYSCAQDKVPSEIKLSRARYDAAIKVATQPIRQRYIEELNKMKSDAMARKNLDLANAIDAEITAISESGKGDGGLAGELAN